MKLCGVLGTSFLALVLVAPALGQDTETLSLDSEESIFSFYSSVGILALESREHVFTAAGSTDHLSLLIWQSTSPVLTAGFDVKLPNNWTFAASTQVSASGIGYMENYDWISPWSPSFAFDDWSHRSQHDNTNLDWFFKGQAAVGYDFAIGEQIRVNTNVGAKYVDVQWAAVDGTYDYSIGGFRDTSGTFAGPGITYRQQIPSVFVGLDAEILQDKWTFDVGVQAGITLAALATDWHWARVPPLRFEEAVVAAPTLAASAGASYAINDSFDLFINGEIEKVFLGRSDTTLYNNTSGALLGSFPDASGAEMFSASMSVGFKSKI